MTAYHKIKKADESLLNELQKLGFLKSTFRRNVAIYESYLKYREQGRSKMEAATFTAEDFHISDRHVFTIVRKFSEDPTTT